MSGPQPCRKLLNHVVAAKGLCSSALAAVELDEASRAKHTADLGVLFLHYAVLDIMALMQLSAIMSRTEAGRNFGETVARCQKALQHPDPTPGERIQ